MTKLNNTYVIRTDDEKFKAFLDKALADHCIKNDVNAAFFELNKQGAEKVMNVVWEESE